MIVGDPLYARNPDGTQSDVLSNKFNTINPEVLAKAESLFIPVRIRQVVGKHDRGEYSGKSLYERLTDIHRTIFQDIYDWAGETRVVNVSKRHANGRDLMQFHYVDALGTDPTKLTPAATDAAKKHFKAEVDGIDRWMQGVDMSDPKNVGLLVAKLNVLHPFREGNGRTACELARQVCAEHGAKFQLDASMVNGWTAARSDAVMGNVLKMQNLMAQIMYPESVAYTRDNPSFSFMREAMQPTPPTRRPS